MLMSDRDDFEQLFLILIRLESFQIYFNSALFNDVYSLVFAQLPQSLGRRHELFLKALRNLALKTFGPMAEKEYARLHDR